MRQSIEGVKLRHLRMVAQVSDLFEVESAPEIRQGASAFTPDRIEIVDTSQGRAGHFSITVRAEGPAASGERCAAHWSFAGPPPAARLPGWLHRLVRLAPALRGEEADEDELVWRGRAVAAVVPAPGAGPETQVARADLVPGFIAHRYTESDEPGLGPVRASVPCCGRVVALEGEEESESLVVCSVCAIAYTCVLVREWDGGFAAMLTVFDQPLVLARRLRPRHPKARARR